MPKVGSVMEPGTASCGQPPGKTALPKAPCAKGRGLLKPPRCCAKSPAARSSERPKPMRVLMGYSPPASIVPQPTGDETPAPCQFFFVGGAGAAGLAAGGLAAGTAGAAAPPG